MTMIAYDITHIPMLCLHKTSYYKIQIKKFIVLFNSATTYMSGRMLVLVLGLVITIH